MHLPGTYFPGVLFHSRVFRSLSCDRGFGVSFFSKFILHEIERAVDLSVSRPDCRFFSFFLSRFFYTPLLELFKTGSVVVAVLGLGYD